MRENHPVPVAEVRLGGFTHFEEAWVRQRLDTSAPAATSRTCCRRRDSSATGSGSSPGTATPASPGRRSRRPRSGRRPGPPAPVVIFTVREGPRTLVRTVSFAGAVALPAAQLLAAARLHEGAPYRAADLQPAADRVRAAYARPGTRVCR